MKSSKRAISKLYVFLITAVLLITSSYSAYSFTTGGGIYAECDTAGTGQCQNVREFRFGSGLCVREQDTWGPDDNCCTNYRIGVVLHKYGRLSDIEGDCIGGDCEGFNCETPDEGGDNPQDVFWSWFRPWSWGFGRDVLVDSRGKFVLCDEVGYYTDTRGDRWYCDGSDFVGPITCSEEGSACSSDGDCCSNNCNPYDGVCYPSWFDVFCGPLGDTRISGTCGNCGQQQQICVDTGSSWDWVDDACINQGVCTPGTTGCPDSNTIATCDSNCQWANSQACSDYNGWYCWGNINEYRDYTDQCYYRGSPYDRYECWDPIITSSVDCNSYDGATCVGDTRTVNDYSCSDGACVLSSQTTENCNNYDGSNYCNGNWQQSRDYYCSAGSCTYAGTNLEDCAAKASTDTDNLNDLSQNDVKTGGTVKDYSGCLNGVCTYNSYSDACSGASLIPEYGASGAGITQSNYNCQNLGINYCGSDNRYYQDTWSCSGSPGACVNVADQRIGTDADNDGVDQQCQDTTCDNTNGVCDVAVAGKCIAKSAEICNDNLDNDCDGKKDCADSDCAGSLGGFVTNQNNNAVYGASITTNGSTAYTASTDMQGKYNITQINCGVYDITASHYEYWPDAKSNIQIQPNQAVRLDFNLLIGTSCEPDCTYVADNIVHASCDGKNGCTFYDDIAKAACDNSQPGWLRDYDATHYVVCASGSPQQKVEIQASVSCASGTLVKMTRIVVFKGKPVKLIVATCG